MLLLGILLNVNFTSCSKDDIVPDTEQGDNNDGSEDGNDDADNDEDKIVHPNGIPSNIPNNIIYYITNDDIIVRFKNEDVFGGAKILSNTYSSTKGYGTIEFASEVTAIEAKAFKSKTTLTYIVLPNSVTSIGEEAFAYCSGLTSVTIPDRVKRIEEEAFRGCSSLTSVHISDIGSWCNVDFKENASNPLSQAHRLYVNGEEVKDLVIPNSVTSIRGYAFYFCSSLTSVTIPNSVKSVGNSAFGYCEGLTSVTIPNSVTSIGNGAFCNCSGLTSITLSDVLSSIGDHAFYGCSSLSSIILPDSLVSIGSSAFEGCKKIAYVINLSKLDISAESTSHGYVAYYARKVYNADELVGDYAFKKSDGEYYLVRYIGTDKSIVLPKNYKGNKYKIGGYAFYDCDSLTSATIPNSVTSIGGGAFAECSSLVSVTIPDSITSIGNETFYKCTSLTSVTLPDSLTKIGSSAFESCGALALIILPKTLTQIGANAFYNCRQLREVLNFSDLNISKGDVSHGYVAYYAGTVNNADDRVGDYAFKESNHEYYLVRYLGADKSITLPENYKGNKYSIGRAAFSGCKSLASVVIPNSVQKIGEYAFYNCNLSSLTIEAGVFYISPNQDDNEPIKVFWLSNTPPDGHTHLEGKINYVPNDQYSCYNRKVYPYLNSMFEVNNMKYVPVSPAERTCELLDCVYDSIDSLVNIAKTVSYKGIPMTVENVGEFAFYGHKDIKEVYVSASLLDCAFKGCSSLAKVSMGDNVKTIGGAAFSGCSSLTKVSMSDNVKTIGEYAFKGCSFSDIKIGTNVKTIGRYAFSSCYSLSAIAIPQATDTIGYGAFSSCTSLTKVAIEDRTTNLVFGGDVFYDCPLDSVYIGGKFVYSSSPFSKNESLRCVTFANNVDSIYSRMFYECPTLKSVTMGAAIVSIGAQAFSGCRSLGSFTFPSAMKAIGDNAFSGCSSMTSLISLAPTPPTCGNMALDDIDKWSCVLKVPESSISAYKAAGGWKEFFFIESLSTAITEVTEDKNLRNGTDIYTIGGMKVTSSGTLPKGVYIVDGKKVIVD